MTRRCDLVLGGGGIRGLAHVGVFEALEAHEYQVVRVAGASAGAVAGSLAVAGLPASEIRRRFDELDFSGFALADVVERFGSVRAIGALIQRWTPERVPPEDWLTEQLAEQGVETFADLRTDDDDATDPPERRYRLVVRALDLVQRRVVRLPWDYARYGLDPDEQSVASAVRASMSIPFVFEPVPIGAEDSPERGLLIDGGLTSGFPVAVLDRQDGQPPRWPTFGIRLLPRPHGAGEVPDGDLELVRSVITALLDSSDLLEPLTSCDERRTVRVDVSDVKPLDVADADAEELMEDGHRAMDGFLTGFDHDTYLAECRQR